MGHLCRSSVSFFTTEYYAITRVHHLYLSVHPLMDIRAFLPSSSYKFSNGAYSNCPQMSTNVGHLNNENQDRSYFEVTLKSICNSSHEKATCSKAFWRYPGNPYDRATKPVLLVLFYGRHELWGFRITQRVSRRQVGEPIILSLVTIYFHLIFRLKKSL